MESDQTPMAQSDELDLEPPQADELDLALPQSENLELERPRSDKQPAIPPVVVYSDVKLAAYFQAFTIRERDLDFFLDADVNAKPEDFFSQEWLLVHGAPFAESLLEYIARLNVEEVHGFRVLWTERVMMLGPTHLPRIMEHHRNVDELFSPAQIGFFGRKFLNLVIEHSYQYYLQNRPCFASWTRAPLSHDVELSWTQRIQVNHNPMKLQASGIVPPGRPVCWPYEYFCWQRGQAAPVFQLLGSVYRTQTECRAVAPHTLLYANPNARSSFETLRGGEAHQSGRQAVIHDSKLRVRLPGALQGMQPPLAKGKRLESAMPASSEIWQQHVRIRSESNIPDKKPEHAQRASQDWLTAPGVERRAVSTESQSNLMTSVSQVNVPGKAPNHGRGGARHIHEYKSVIQTPAIPHPYTPWMVQENNLLYRSRHRNNVGMTCPPRPDHIRNPHRGLDLFLADTPAGTMWVPLRKGQPGPYEQPLPPLVGQEARLAAATRAHTQSQGTFGAPSHSLGTDRARSSSYTQTHRHFSQPQDSQYPQNATTITTSPAVGAVPLHRLPSVSRALSLKERTGPAPSRYGVLSPLLTQRPLDRQQQNFQPQNSHFTAAAQNHNANYLRYIPRASSNAKTPQGANPSDGPTHRMTSIGHSDIRPRPEQLELLMQAKVGTFPLAAAPDACKKVLATGPSTYFAPSLVHIAGNAHDSIAVPLSESTIPFPAFSDDAVGEPKFTKAQECSPLHIGPDAEDVVELWFGNVPQGTSPEELRAFLEQTMPVARVMEMRICKPPSPQFCYTFVIFHSNSDARRALEGFQGALFGGAHLRVQVPSRRCTDYPLRKRSSFGRRSHSNYDGVFGMQSPQIVRTTPGPTRTNSTRLSLTSSLSQIANSVSRTITFSPQDARSDLNPAQLGDKAETTKTLESGVPATRLWSDAAENVEETQGYLRDADTTHSRLSSHSTDTTTVPNAPPLESSTEIPAGHEKEEALTASPMINQILVSETKTSKFDPSFEPNVPKDGSSSLSARKASSDRPCQPILVTSHADTTATCDSDLVQDKKYTQSTDCTSTTPLANDFTSAIKNEEHVDMAGLTDSEKAEIIAKPTDLSAAKMAKTLPKKGPAVTESMSVFGRRNKPKPLLMDKKKAKKDQRTASGKQTKSLDAVRLENEVEAEIHSADTLNDRGEQVPGLSNKSAQDVEEIIVIADVIAERDSFPTFPVSQKQYAIILGDDSDESSSTEVTLRTAREYPTPVANSSLTNLTVSMFKKSGADNNVEVDTTPTSDVGGQVILINQDAPKKGRRKSKKKQKLSSLVEAQNVDTSSSNGHLSSEQVETEEDRLYRDAGGKVDEEIGKNAAESNHCSTRVGETESGLIESRFHQNFEAANHKENARLSYAQAAKAVKASSKGSGGTGFTERSANIARGG